MWHGCIFGSSRLAGAALLAGLLLVGCEDEGDDGAEPERASGTEGELDTTGEPVDPPFEVSGDCDGLLLAWFDEEGVRTARSREQIPEARRERVRVDSLRIPPEERLGPEWVYVADLREPGDDGGYPVRQMRRAAFDALVDAAGAHAGSAGAGPEPPSRQGAQPDADVVIYGAEWCKACDEAADFFERRGVPYVEKNIEKSSSALAEMQRKARQAGLSPSGIPIIDFKGTLVQGFDRGRLEKLIGQSAQPI